MPMTQSSFPGLAQLFQSFMGSGQVNPMGGIPGVNDAWYQNLLRQRAAELFAEQNRRMDQRFSLPNTSVGSTAGRR